MHEQMYLCMRVSVSMHACIYMNTQNVYIIYNLKSPSFSRGNPTHTEDARSEGARNTSTQHINAGHPIQRAAFAKTVVLRGLARTRTGDKRSRGRGRAFTLHACTLASRSIGLCTRTLCGGTETWSSPFQSTQL